MSLHEAPVLENSALTDIHRLMAWPSPTLMKIDLRPGQIGRDPSATTPPCKGETVFQPVARSLLHRRRFLL